MTTSAVPASEHHLAKYRDEFPIFRHSIYLNSCSLGALSRRSRVRVTEYLDLWERRGAAAWYDVWWAALQELRQGYGRLLGAAPHEIALQPSISVALSAVAEALDYRTRRKVVVTSLDFPTIAYQWLAKASEGVEVEVVESPDGTTVPVEQFERAVDDRTALVATSHVFYTSGALQDVSAIASIAHRHGALLLIDGYQAAGQLPIEVCELGVDFYCAGGLKWLLGGSGITFLYVSENVTRRLRSRIAGWFGHREQFSFDPRSLERWDDARHFELGTPAMASVYAQLGGLEILEEIGIPEIRRVTAALTEDLIESAHARGFRPKVALNPEERTAIVMLPTADPHRAVRQLAEAGIVADARSGHVRISPFFYNLRDDHRAALERMASD